MTADKHDFFQQWGDFLTGAMNPFACDEQTVTRSKRGAGQLFETADDAYQTMLSHYDRLLSQHADMQGMPALDTFMGFDLKLKDMADAYADLLGAMANLNALNLEAATAPLRQRDHSPHSARHSGGHTSCDRALACLGHSSLASSPHCNSHCSYG